MNDVMCGNAACGCHVSEDDVYCSEACQTAASLDRANGEAGCECPHADCQVGADIEPVVYSELTEIEKD